MARFYPSNSVSSSGVTSDDVTITSYDVPESKTAITSDSDDEVIQGKLKEYDSEVESVGSIDNKNNRVHLTVPTRGLYSLTAKLFTSFSDLANLIGLVASKIAQGESILGINGTYKGLGDATQADVRTGKTFSTAEFSDVPGTMAEHAGGTYKPGTSDKIVVPADRYLIGDIIFKGDQNLKPENIKRNVTIFGIKGTCEGYFPDPKDLYNAGNNINGFETGSHWQLNSSYITVKKCGSGGSCGGYLHSGDGIDFTGFNYLCIDTDVGVADENYPTPGITFYVRRSNDASSSNSLVAIPNPTDSKKGVRHTLKLDVRSISGTAYVVAYYNHNSFYAAEGNIYRIWLE